MKKAVVALTILLLIASIVVTAYAFSVVIENKDKVEIREEILYGDVSKAEGLSISNTSSLDDILLWKTTYKPGKNPVTETEYSYGDTRSYAQSDIHTDLYLHTDVASSDSHFLDSNYDSNGYPYAKEENIIYQMKQEMDEGGNSHAYRKVNISDYYDYYPVCGYIQAGKYSLHLDDTAYTNTPDGEFNSVEQQARLIQEYFKIPVLEGDCFDIYIEDEGPYGLHYSFPHEVYQNYLMSAYSDYTEEAIYFTFTSHANDGQVVDTTKIPGGYGIYRLPYEENTTKAEDLETIYSLDPSVKIEAFKILKNKAGQDQILLHTEEDGDHYITVIDIETRERVQKLKYYSGSFPEDSYEQFLYEQNVFALRIAGEKLIVISRDDEGILSLDFTVPLDEYDFLDYYYIARIAYDGEKLAISDIENEIMSHMDLQLAIYTEDGLQYCGDYTSSLDVERDYRDYDYSIYSFYDECFKITW